MQIRAVGFSQIDKESLSIDISPEIFCIYTRVQNLHKIVVNFYEQSHYVYFSMSEHTHAVQCMK